MADEAEGLRREIEYYRRQIDELGGETVKLDYAVSGLRHQLNQKRQAFTVLSELEHSVAAQPEISAILDRAIRAINATLDMDRTVVLVPAEAENHYRPGQWLGFPEEESRKLSSLVFCFPPEFAAGTGVLVVNKATAPTKLINEIRIALDLPFFVCLPVTAGDSALGLLLAGRLKEARPLYPPFDQGDVETFQAIASLVASYVRALRIGVLEQADRLKTEFFANVSHEFRTPITLTLGPLELILASRYGEIPAAVCQQIEIALRNQEQLLGLVNQILDLAKFEAGGMELKASPMADMNRFIEERVGRFGSGAQERGLELRLVLDPRVPGAEIFIDRDKFGKLLFNLLSNAFKFTREGHVEVATSIHGDSFRLTVSDSGIGIRPDQLPYIFDRFRQADGSESREFAGTGIGLALVKEIAALHGGDARVFSQYGSGSTFEVTVPLGKSHLSAANLLGIGDEGLADVEERGRTTEPVTARHRPDPVGEPVLIPGRHAILYVEDNRDLRGYVRDVLAQQFNVLLAVDGADGLDKARRYRPDLIVTDQMMPRMSGRDLLRAIRDDPDLAPTPVLFVTARAGTEARIESLEAGADDYLAKPFHEAELTARIRNLLRARTQERELARLNRELAELNRSLERRVEQQIGELERLARLKRFLSPQVAELIVAGDVEDPLKSHRREVAAAFIDLRGFTAFAESAEPEEVMQVLREYHAVMGRLVLSHEGTLERFTGDGMIVLFNDPVPIANPAEQAIRMATAMRIRIRELLAAWQKFGYDLDFGVGIAQGYATIGAIGFEQRYDYTAIGSVMNLAARLCGEAKPGQILISQRVLAMVEDLVEIEPVGPLVLKGFHRPVAAHNLLALK